VTGIEEIGVERLVGLPVYPLCGKTTTVGRLTGNCEGATETNAWMDANVEAVAEQTGDVGVEPQEDESTLSHDGEGDTASIIEVRNQVIELSTDVIGRSLDGIVEVSRTDDSWRAVVEIIERRSVPDTQDILGQYEIELDEAGEVIGDQLEFGEERLPPATEVPDVADVLDDLLVRQRPDGVLAGRVLCEPLDVDRVAAEEVVARRESHRDRLVLPIRERHLQAVEEDVHVNLAATTVLPDLAEDHLAERSTVQRLLAEDLLQGLVDVDGVKDRVAVRRDVEQGIRVGLADECLVAKPTRLDDRVEPIRLDPLVDVGILVGYARLDSARQVANRLGEGGRLVDRLLFGVPRWQFCVGATIETGEHDPLCWFLHL
jgi:uncharacterized protein YuzE